MNTAIKWILFVIGFCIYAPIIIGGDEAADRWLDYILALLPREVVLGFVWVAVGAVALGATTCVVICAIMVYRTDIKPRLRELKNTLHTKRSAL